MTATKRKRPTTPRSASAISDQLRAVIVARRLSPYAVAQAANVAPSVMTRFVHGQRGLTLDTLDRVADALGLRLVEVARRGKLQGRPEKGAVAPIVTAPVDIDEPAHEPERTEHAGPDDGLLVSVDESSSVAPAALSDKQ